jgi:hypothetical protein
MKKNYILLLATWAILLSANGQHIGIGTLTPTANLEVKNPGLSTIKISSASNMDTTKLIFSNRDEFIGTDMSLTFLHEQGLFFSSKSLFPYLDSDSILYMTPGGYVGINTISPVERLDVNGRISSNGLLLNEYSILELGAGLNKQEDNGKIGLNVFGENNTLSIVGGGTAPDGSDRLIKFWADSTVLFTGKGSFLKNVGIGVLPTANMLTLAANHGSLLSVRNTNTLNTGVMAAISFGGNNYTTGIIRTVGNSPSNARMAFLTGYSFTGGASNLQENLTIANNGNIGVKNSDPKASLDIGGNIRFSGTNPAAFKLTLKGIMMYNGSGPAAVIDSTNGDYVRIDHPMCNNDPNAMLVVSPVTGKSMRVIYDDTNGYWYLVNDFPYRIQGTQGVNYLTCDGTCIDSAKEKFILVNGFSPLNKDFDSWNMFIVKK